MIDLRKKLQDWDRAIKSGQMAQVRKELFSLKGKHIPRHLVCDLADLGRRTQLNFLVVGWLKSYVRPDAEILAESTTQERALYASGLMRIGAHNEAHFILKNVTKKRDPLVLLFRAHLEILRWNYEKSISFLRSYLMTIETQSYAHLVGRLNLVAAHVAEMDWLQAEPELKALLHESRDKNFLLIYSNCLELLAQVALHKAQFSRAENYLDEASKNLKGSDTNYELFVEKWKVIIQLMKSGPDEATLERWQQLKEKSTERRSWETLRELDFFKASSTRDSELYQQVHFGTPFPSYRKRMRRIYMPAFSIPESTIWDVNSGADESSPLINLRRDLTSNPLMLSALRALSKDFYRPFRVGQLMQEIYPHEYFNPLTSPQRIFQTIRRLRLWFKENNYPLDITLHHGEFRLQAMGPVRLQVYGRLLPIKKINVPLQKFLLEWTQKTFTSSDLQQFCGIKTRKAQRILLQAIHAEALTRVQVGNKTIYKKK